MFVGQTKDTLTEGEAGSDGAPFEEDAGVGVGVAVAAGASPEEEVGSVEDVACVA